MKFYLIQTGLLNNNINLNDIKGLDSLVTFHYMGSAEFEFNALSNSLKNIVKNSDNYEFSEINEKCLKNVNNESMFLYCDKNFNKKEYINCIKKNATGNLGTKKYTKLYSYLNNNINELEIENFSNRKYCNYCNFWWDIENNVFFFYGKSKKEKIIKAIECLKEKWKNELFPKPIKKGLFNNLKNICLKNILKRKDKYVESYTKRNK